MKLVHSILANYATQIYASMTVLIAKGNYAKLNSYKHVLGTWLCVIMSTQNPNPLILAPIITLNMICSFNFISISLV